MSIAKPAAAYSFARAVQLTPTLKLLYISGSTARQPDGTVPPFGLQFDESLNVVQEGVPTPAEVQTQAVLDKIASVISDATNGSHGLESLVELTIFVRDLKRDFAAVNKVYNGVIGERFRALDVPLPARTCVQVGMMPPDERTLVEIKAVASIETAP